MYALGGWRGNLLAEQHGSVSTMNWYMMILALWLQLFCTKGG